MSCGEEAADSGWACVAPPCARRGQCGRRSHLLGTVRTACWEAPCERLLCCLGADIATLAR
eukprot:6199975-Pleurochrysis_carterae.AAC.1